MGFSFWVPVFSQGGQSGAGDLLGEGFAMV
jgi:hypothetical protein